MASPAAKDSIGGPVDLQALIAEFVADEDSTSLELPAGLSAEQRKEARRLADQHGDLKCESYGFGEERRLHLFKKGQDRVRVKNTFIDDWEGAKGEEPAFRSMPPCMPVDLLERTLQRCLDDKSELREGSSGATSPRSTTTAGGTETVRQLDGSPASSAPDLPPMPEGFKVRNTFIHIESVPVVERIVQSMPHGMFRQCLQAELSAQSPAGAAQAPAPAEPALATAPAAAPAAAGELALVPGTEVVIQGLVKLPDFNGLTGVVQSLDTGSGRYDVLLDGPAGQCGWRWVKVKGENCRLRMPPPPRNAPTLATDCLSGGPQDEGDAGKSRGAASVPPTPTWDEDFSCQAGIDQKSNATPLKLNALV